MQGALRIGAAELRLTRANVVCGAGMQQQTEVRTVQESKSDRPPPRTERAHSPRKRPIWKRPVIVLLGTALIGFFLFLGLRSFISSLTHESTDDAFLDGDIVSVAPKVAGQVKAVHVIENQPVASGALLVEIDPADLDVQLAQKQAALEASHANSRLLRASFELLQRQVDTARALANQSQAEAEAARATADRANADWKRAENLIGSHAISQQEYDSAKAAALSANANFKAAQQKAASDESKVAETEAQLEAGRRALERAEAQAKQTAIDVKAADLNLSYTHVLAPAAGHVTRKAVEAGDYVQAGQRLLALVPTNLWVTANFKETQLTQIRPGQRASIRIDSLEDRSFAAHVESIQAGSGARFSLLPPENAVGNYVKVVQRVPVRIVFDAPPQFDHVLGPGMSVVPSVRVRGWDVPRVIIGLVAIVLAAAVGFVWWRLATSDDTEA